MSDLIGYLEGFREHLDPDKKTNVRLGLSEIDEILAALQTLQRIEGLRQLGRVEVSTSNRDWHVRVDRYTPMLTYLGHKNYYADTLPLAIEAAVGADEKGEV